MRRYLKLKKYSHDFKMTTGICVDDNRFYDPRVGVLDESRGIRSRPYVVYQVENREYGILSKVVYGGVAAFLVKGKKFKVLYNPDDPNDAILKNGLNFFFCFFLFTAVFFVVCLYLFTPIVYDSTREDYKYSVFCTFSDSEYKMSNQVIAKSDKEALQKFQNQGISALTCKNLRLEKEKIN